MKKIAFLIIFTLMMLMVTFTVFGQEGEQQIILKFNTLAKNFDQIGDTNNQVFIDELKKRLGDRIEVMPFFGATLGNTSEAAFGGLQNKSFELLGYSTAGISTYTDAFVPLDAPYLIKNEDVVYDIVTGDIAETMKERCLQDTGLRVLYLNMNGFRYLTNSRNPATSPDDLKGMKIRVQENPIHMQMIRAMGASPTPIPFTELFTALQQGVVDGQENPITMIKMYKLYEVQKYLTLSKHLFLFAGVYINEEYFQSLPADVQQALLDAARIAQEYSYKEITEGEEELLNEIGEIMEITELTEEQYNSFKNKMTPIWSSIAEDIGADYFNDIKNRTEVLNAKY